MDNNESKSERFVRLAEPRVSVLSAKRLNISVSLSKSSTPFLRMHRTTQSHFGSWLSLSGLWQMRISFISPRVGRMHAAA